MTRQSPSPGRSTALSLLSSLAVAALAAALYRRVWGGLGGFVAAIDPRGTLLFSDFLLHYLPAGQGLFATGAPAPGYFYSVFFALLLASFGTPSLATATWVWGGLQLLAVALLAWLPGRRFRHDSAGSYSLHLVALALSVPLLHNFKWGQISSFLTLAVLFACLCYSDRRPGLAAVGLAAATAVKYYPGFFALYFLLRRRGRFLAVFAASTLLLLAVLPAAVLGPRRAFEFQRLAVEQARVARATWVPVDPNSQYVASVLPRWAGGSPASETLRFWRLAGYAVCLFNLAAVWRLGRLPMRREIRHSFALLLCSTPFFLDTSWPHYFIYLPFCQAVAYLGLGRGSAWPREATGRAAGAHTALALASVFLASVPLLLWFGDWTAYAHAGALFFANLLCLAALHLGVWQPPADPGTPL